MLAHFLEALILIGTFLSFNCLVDVGKFFWDVHFSYLLDDEARTAETPLMLRTCIASPLVT